MEINSKWAQRKQKYETSRLNLLFMIILSFINMVLLLLQADIMLLFSASIPYFIIILGIMLRGGFIASIIAFSILFVYLICWRLSSKSYKWLIVALVLFIVDTLFLVWAYIGMGNFSGTLDVLIHIWVLYYLVIGVKSGYELKK